ncbi:MAG: antitoxin [Desulfobacterales bacterium]|jgi:hypothetical protein|nr:antitoxin [Desulfobacterales bacterium]
MKAVTIRGVDSELAEKLKTTAKKQGKSVNQLTIELIQKSLGLKKEKKFSQEYDDLDDLFGRWSEDEFNAVDGKISRERFIDPELWQ